MQEIELGSIQERFADLVWANEPIGSGDLVKLCPEEGPSPVRTAGSRRNQKVSFPV